MSKRVGIITYTNTTNYGAILQSIALKTIVQEMGYTCEVINYNCPAVKKRESLLLNTSGINIKGIIKSLVMLPISIKRKATIHKFIRINKILTRKSFSPKDIAQVNNLYDTIIVGSDQVWNPRLNGSDETYMLNFVDEKINKVAYAASIGNNNIIDEYESYFNEYIKSFKHIGIREKSTSDILNKKYGLNTKYTLDPTMLIAKEKWNNIIKNSQIKKLENYVLLYFIHNGEESFSKARIIANKLNCKIIYLNNYGIPVAGMTNVFSVTPYDFVNYINNAQLVITGSFHGIAFSINQNKNFIIELSNKTKNANERVQNLIDTFNLNNTINQINTEEFDIKQLKKIIDYGRINKTLEECRASSILYLKEWLRNE